MSPEFSSLFSSDLMAPGICAISSSTLAISSGTTSFASSATITTSDANAASIQTGLRLLAAAGFVLLGK